jgi:hypothetical protein
MYLQNKNYTNPALRGAVHLVGGEKGSMRTGSKKRPRSVSEKGWLFVHKSKPPVEIARLRSELPDLIAMCLRVYVVS